MRRRRFLDRGRGGLRGSLGAHAARGADDRPARYDPAALVLLDVFQYFVGNTDWSAFAGPAGEQCCHNVVPFARADGVLLPVPYDFDATGIVNAPYSLPDERLRIQRVRQRLYRGRCREVSELQPAFRPIRRAACGDQRAVHAGRGPQRENGSQRARLRRRVLRLGGRCGQARTRVSENCGR